MEIKFLSMEVVARNLMYFTLVMLIEYSHLLLMDQQVTFRELRSYQVRTFLKFLIHLCVVCKPSQCTWAYIRRALTILIQCVCTKNFYSSEMPAHSFKLRRDRFLPVPLHFFIYYSSYHSIL
jgi:hypothetical protein